MFRKDPRTPIWLTLLERITAVAVFVSVCFFAAVVTTAVMNSGVSHDAYPAIAECDDPRTETFYNGAVRDIRVEERELEYFTHPSRPVEAYADHLHGVISLQPGLCGEGTADWVMAHELAHGLDYLHSYRLTDDAHWTDLHVGHADEVDNGERELFAFCMTALLLEGHDAYCPEGNRQATLDVLKLHGLEGVLNR